MFLAYTSRKYKVTGKYLSWVISICVVIFLFCILSDTSNAATARITAVQSINIKPYNDSLKGFINECMCDVDQVILSDLYGVDIKTKLRNSKPDVIVAIGIDALKRVKAINDIPIVYLMVLNSQSELSGNNNITGVNMNIAPERQLRIIKETNPKINRIGVIFDPARKSQYVRNVIQIASSMKIKMITKEIHNLKDFPVILNSMKDEIDAYWMLPDVTVVKAETVELVMLFSLENRVPVITFADKYLDMGAMMSLGIDAHDIGRQAAKIVKSILAGAQIEEKSINARRVVVTINQKVARKLGITISTELNTEETVINLK